MGAQGSTTIDFGAFPGAPDISRTIASTDGATGILNTSLVEAWIYPLGTADHSLAEHYVDPPRVMAGEISTSSSSFVIRAFGSGFNTGNYPLMYGKWTVNWCWN